MREFDKEATMSKGAEWKHDPIKHDPAKLSVQF